MKKNLVSIIAIGLTACILNAGDKYSDLTQEYLNNLPVKIKRVIANDPQTANKTLEILFQDKDLSVRENVVANPSF